MNGQANPSEERFQNIESVLIQLANGQRQLLTSQVLMADEQTKTQKAVQDLAQHMRELDGVVEKLSGVVEKLSGVVEKLSDKVDKLADGQKHADDRIDALADIVRDLIERDRGGNGKHIQ